MGAAIIDFRVCPPLVKCKNLMFSGFIDTLMYGPRCVAPYSLHRSTNAEKSPFISNTGHLYCSNTNVSNLYFNDVIIYKIKNSREKSFVCERVYPITILFKFLSSFMKRTVIILVVDRWYRQKSRRRLELVRRITVAVY
jgi:hypothetical protein